VTMIKAGRCWCQNQGLVLGSLHRFGTVGWLKSVKHKRQLEEGVPFTN
jgi:hypothetical protein